MTTNNPSPLKNANWISRFCFFWLTPLFVKGREKHLDDTDLYDLVDEDCSKPLIDKLENEWNKELQKSNPSLRKALFRVFGLQFGFIGCFVFLEESFRSLRPVLFGRLMECFTQVGVSPGRQLDAYMYATSIVVSALISAGAHHLYFFGAIRISMWLRIASSGLVYRKLLRLNQEALVSTSSGNVMNLLTNDLEKFESIMVYLHYIWAAPLQALVVFLILWSRLGAPTIAGFLLVLLLVGVQAWIARMFAIFRQQCAKLTDERVKIMSELINGIRVIKFYCWEKVFLNQVNCVRSSYIRRLILALLMCSIATVIFFVGIKLMLLIMIIVYEMLSEWQTLSRQDLWPVLVASNLLRRLLLNRLKNTSMSICDCHITIFRLHEFLILPELRTNENNQYEKIDDALSKEATPLLEISKSVKKYENTKQIDGLLVNRKEYEKPGLFVENLSASWYQSDNCTTSVKNSGDNTLSDLTFWITEKELLAIVGPVGAGKSSLLMALLGELSPSSGRVEIRGKLGYVPQQAWVFSDTLRNNILCGEPFDEERYQNALHCAALLPDVALLRSGDQTLVGERGIVLSGGQRARVSLARAVYQNADVYLLDDPLSAVDATVALELFQRCIEGALANKPRILITHHIQFARQADRILIFENGCITHRGTFKELLNNQANFLNYLNLNEDDEVSDLCKSVNTSIEASETSSFYSNQKGEEKIVPEKRFRGEITWKTYLTYFRACGHPIFHFLLIVLLSCYQTFYFLSDWWLTHWLKDDKLNPKHNETFESLFNSMNSSEILNNTTMSTRGHNLITGHYYLMVYAALVVGLFIVSGLQNITFFAMSIHASHVIHNRVVSRLLGAPMLFYDTTPAGRILNRCSKDFGTMDEKLPQIIQPFVVNLFVVLWSVIIAFVNNFWVIAPSLILLALSFYWRMFYSSACRDIMRLESTARSLVLSHTSNTLIGLTSVRAMKLETKFKSKFTNLLDRSNAAYFLYFCGIRWYTMRLDVLCIFFLTFVVFTSVWMADVLNNSMMGLTLTYAISLQDHFYLCIFQSSLCENHILAVERILEYCELDQEETSKMIVAPPTDWPRTGSITFQNVSFRYSLEQPQVLHRINFKINPMEKIGIVGRTGSGKSSLLAALFRLAEIESDDGCILIDDISTRNLPLSTLRSQLSMIPQDPVLFSGSVRHNLDPFGKCDDAQIWRTLEEVQLGKAVALLNGGLDYKVVEGGHNFSVGQRQLLCLARALILRNRILIIDEATANVDPHTDALIQATLRSQFTQCTVLTVAHRLQTVIDSDRLLVLDDGRVVQFDHPHCLLELKSGHLFDLVESLGSDDANALMLAARDSFEKQQSFKRN